MTPCTVGRALLVAALASWSAAASPRTAAGESPRAAGPQSRADLATRVASLVDAFPADNPAARDALCAEILALGPQAVAAVLGRVQAPGQGDDSKARFAANGLVVHAGHSAGTGERTLVAGALADALARARDPNVGTFFLSQLQLLGGRESLRAIARHLPDEALAAPAAAAVVAIGGPEAARALLGALDKAPAGARLSIVDGLGRLRSREAVKPLLALADGPEPPLRQAARAALAAIGDPAAAAVLSRSRVDSGYRDRAQAPALYLHYARRLVESGHEAEGLAAARAVLDGYRRPGESQHAAEALALIVSARKEQALTDLLAASEAPDRTLRGAALALASRIPGPAATARWVEKASAAPPQLRAEIVAMLGERGDAAALPLLRESLRAEDKALRLAAAPAAARVGGDAVLPELFERLRTADAEECAVLKRVLLGYPAASVTPRALELVETAPLPAKAVLIQVLGEKHARDASELIYRLAEDAEPATREAALVALASLAGEADVPRLVALLDKATAGDDAVRLREAITAAVLRSPDSERRADGLLQLLQKAPPAGKVAILRLLPRVGGAAPLRAVAQESASPDPEVQSAAIGALARWPEYQAADELLRIAATAARRDQARSALQGYVRLVARSEQPAYEKIAAFERALALPGGDAAKAVFSAIAALREPESLRLLGRCLDRPELHDAAAAALLELASRQEPDERWLSGHEAYSLLRRVEASLSEPAARERAATIIAERLKQGGFVPLFDSRSLDGWKGLVADPAARAKLGRDELAKAQAAADARMREHWKVVEGVLTFDGKGENLCTAREYGDFELLVDWKIEKGGDSGLYLRGAPQVQIWDADANPAGSGGLYNNERAKSQPLEKADRPVGEWNAFRVVMIGERVTVYLNDKRVVDEAVLENYWERDKPIYASGPIELQAHGNPLAFRNLYIREIPRDVGPPAASVDAGEGFVPLFNGRDLDGWTGNVEGYAVENGRIVVHPERAGGNLYTAKEYADFVLRLEFKLTPAANNGIGIRAPLEGDAAYAGLELQVLEDGSPVYWDLQPYQYHGSVYGIVPARRGVLRPIGEWNTEEVTVQGRRVAVTVNGVSVVDADLDEASARGTLDHKEHPGLKRTTGHIGFLGHGSTVAFRNLRIRELR